MNNLVEEWNRIKTGEKYFIQYKLEFPVFKAYSGTPPLPTVKSVIVNDRVLCSGETPSEYAELMCEKKIVYIYIHLCLPSDWISPGLLQVEFWASPDPVKVNTIHVPILHTAHV